MELTVWGIITALIVGLIVGALGRLVVPGRQNMPIWLHMLIGVGAALLGTSLARAIGIATETAGVDWGELLVQVVVAAIAVALVAGVGRRRSVTTGNDPHHRDDGRPTDTVGRPFGAGRLVAPGFDPMLGRACPRLRYGRLASPDRPLS